MGFYIRKSIRLGPVRFNLSKSGIGVSAGIPGLRVGMNSRGNYIHAGRAGFYYRTTIPKSKGRAAESTSPIPKKENDFDFPSDDSFKSAVGHFADIDSGDIAQMRDIDSAALLDEINEKMKKLLIWPFILGIGTFLTFAALSVDLNVVWQIAIPAATLLATILFFVVDNMRKTVVLLYDFDDARKNQYEKLHTAFEVLAKSSRILHVQAEASVRDGKRHGGASKLLKINPVRLTKSTPKLIKTNIEVPAFPAGKQTLYFFPDRVLVFEQKGAGTVAYKDLEFNVEVGRMIEDGPVPSDAKIVDYTWRYVNKKGGPDKRFSNNAQLPITLSSTLDIISKNGLNERFQFSNSELGPNFTAAVKNM